ncbi:MAG: ATP-binding protein [Candidatus Cloacimonetes bacterium]|nr:ATP-binding protein [Candidatus Cloacimonadota bacterium]
MNYDEIKKAETIPEASSMIETFRAIGYSLETAIADIIDNSISANAKNIYINRVWKGGKSIISIKDDGIGMSDEDIIKAMRPGTQNPLSERTDTDLGRFGLGLKTASFSQCRTLSVLSKLNNLKPAFWSWDLDYVSKSNKWEVLQWIPDDFSNDLDDLHSGTLVLWSNLDKIVSLQTSENDENAKQKFSSALDKVKKHVAMTFHRFIEEKIVKIFWGEHEIEAWNPFCINEAKTQAQPDENIIGGAKMKGYVLPHKNNFSSEQAYKIAEGVNGYPTMQGFYVYRGKRLLLAGDWLGLFRKEEQYKLVRIQMDLPNKLDTEWQIDIKKSKANPPAVCRDQLESYAKSVRNIGMEVYRHRGKILKQRAGQTFQPLWLEKKKDNKWSFVVNREHLIIQNLKNQAKEKPEQAIETLLCFIEESIPTSAIYIKKAEDKEEKEILPFSDVDMAVIKQILLDMFKNQVQQGKTHEQAKAILKTIEPFNNYEDLIEDLR